MIADIRARRRPRAILWLWAWELVTAVIVATPIYAWARAAYGDHPDGDAVLFRPGGHALLTWLDDGTAALPIVVRSSFVFLAVALVVFAPLVTGTVVAALVSDDDGRAPSFLRSLRTSLGAFLPLLALSVIVAVIEAILLGAGIFLAGAFEAAFQVSLGDASSFTADVLIFAVFLAAALVVGVIGDLARVEIVRGGAAAEPNTNARARALGSLRDGIIAGLRVARRKIGAATIGWGWRAGLGAALALGGAAASDVAGGRGGIALLALAGVHQLVMLARAALRASWLAKAVRLVDSAGPARPASEPARPASEPARPASEPARPTSEPPRPTSEPPTGPASEPPTGPASEPPTGPAPATEPAT